MERRSVLTEVESKELLETAGIPVVETLLARNREEAVAESKIIGFPVALKVCSPQIIHKSDCGGVKLWLDTPRTVEEAYDEIMRTATTHHSPELIQGVAVQKMAPPGIETIIGVSKDPHFGHVIMFGLGGIFVEVLNDVAFRIIPITPKDARQMIEEIKGYRVLLGYRGQYPVSIEALVEILCRVSAFIENNQKIVEVDLNPVFACADLAIAADARIMLSA